MITASKSTTQSAHRRAQKRATRSTATIPLRDLAEIIAQIEADHIAYGKMGYLSQTSVLNRTLHRLRSLHPLLKSTKGA